MLDSYFKISQRGSTVGREVRGGIVTFFTMAYIVALNPLIIGLSKDVDGKRTYQIRLNPENTSSTKLKLTIEQKQVRNASRPNSFNSRAQLNISVTICAQSAGIDVDKGNVAQITIPNGLKIIQPTYSHINLR